MQTVQQFGQTIKAKYPQYKDLSDEEIGSKMLAKYPQYKDMVSSQYSDRDQQFDQGPIESKIDAGGHGIYDIPLLGTLLRGASHPFLQAGNVAAELGGLAGHSMTDPDKSYRIQYLSPSQNKAMNPNSPDAGIGETLLGGAKTGAGVAAVAGPAKFSPFGSNSILSMLGNSAVTGGLRGGAYGFGASERGNELRDTTVGGTVGAILNPIVDVLRSGMLTKGGAANKATLAAADSTDTGQTKALTKIQKQAAQEVKDRYGDTPEVRQALSKVLNPEDTGQLASRPIPKNASELLDWRRQIANREGSNFFQTVFKGSDLDAKVSRTVRDVISQNVHQMAPGTVLPDQIYALYSKLGGDVPKLGAELAGIGGAGAAGISLLNYLLGRH